MYIYYIYYYSYIKIVDKYSLENIKKQIFNKYLYLYFLLKKII